MKKIFTFICLLATFVGIAQAQSGSSEKLLQQKYWNYRDNFRKNYIRIGSQQGRSLPAASIDNYWREENNKLSPMNLTCDSFKLNTSRVEVSFPVPKAQRPEYWDRKMWADVLAWQDAHLGTLATEYWLLTHAAKRDEEAITAIKNEIYYAIFAIDRLDNGGEKYFEPTYSGTLKNGFLIRDDVSCAITEPAYKGYDYGGKYMTSNYDQGIWFTDSIHTSTGLIKFYGPDSWRLHNAQPWVPNAGNEMSQDQLIGLFSGFAFIQKFVDWDVEVDPDGSGTDYVKKNLVSWTAEITDRIMQNITKTRTDIKMYDGETYEKMQQKKNKERVTDGWMVNTSDPHDQISHPEWASLSNSVKADYTALDSTYWSYIDINNRTIADSANYVLVNPAENDRHVYRGPYAFAFGNPLELIGEKLASANQNTPKDYPSAFLAPSTWTRNRITLLNAPVTGPLAFHALGFGQLTEVYNMTVGVFINGDEMLGLYDDAIVECPAAFIAPYENLDIFSICIFGRSFNPEKPIFWEKVWKKMGTNGFLIQSFATIESTNLVTNLMQWLVPVSGTWSHADYKYFYDLMGQPYNEILYASLNDKQPLKSRDFYKDILDKAPMEGANNAAHSTGSGPFKRNQLWRRTDGDTSWTVGSSKYNGLHFMLMYNLYRINSIKYWDQTPSALNYEYSPKPPKTNVPFPATSINIKSLGIENYIDTSITIGNNQWAHKFRPKVPYPILDKWVNGNPVYKHIDTVKTGIAYPEYQQKQIGIHIPDFICRNYEVG